jgi:hypothetical protein
MCVGNTNLPVRFTPVCERWFACRSFMRVRQEGTERHSHKRAHRPGHAHAEVVGDIVLALTPVPREWAALLREEAATTRARVGFEALESRHRRRCEQECAYKSPPRKRIARSDGGTRPSSRFPTRSLQRNGSCASLLRRSSEPRGRAAVGAHRYVSAVSAEIAGGTLPEKRFSARFLRRNVSVQHARVARETAPAAGHTGRPAG